MYDLALDTGRQWLDNMSTDLSRYVIFAVGVWLVLWVALAIPLRGRKIRPETPPARQLVIELLVSIRSIAIFSTIGLGTFMLERAGWLPGPDIARGWGPVWFWVSLALMIVAHDVYFYWVHRANHDPRLFRRFHRRHHKSFNPSPFTAYSFDLGEAALMGAFVPLWVVLVPTPWPAVGLFVLHQIVRKTLGHSGYEILQKVSLRPITIKKGVRVYVLYKFATRDVAKNFGYDELASLLRSLFAEGFSSGHLFTTTNDLQLEIGRKGRSRLNVAKPTHTAAPVQRHDREKQHLVDPGRFYLNALGITDDSGRVRDKAQDKWRQINKFVEILGNLVEHSALKNRTKLRIVDMGSGKGYLTFAVFDQFANTLGLDVQMTGVEARNDLVSICSNIANAGEFRGLSFCTGSNDNFDATGCEILIALHACNTATDDAI